MREKKWILALVIVAVPLLGSHEGVCGGESHQEEVVLTNEDTANPVHLWSPTESIGPDNKVEIGKLRTVTVEIEDPAAGASFVFKAGRSGATLAEVTCTWIDARKGLGSHAVAWNGSALACRNWD